MTYWREIIDKCLRKHVNVLLQLYKIYSVKKVKPGKAKFMCLDEFLEIARRLEVIGGESGIFEKDLNYIFRVSMMLRKDELNSDLFIEMSFVEFLEAFCRMTDDCCPFYEDVN